MGQRRRKKKREKEERLADLRARKPTRYLRVLSILGLSDGFERLHPRVKERVWRNDVPKPEVVIDASAQGCRETRTVKAQLETVLSVTQLKLSNDQSISLSDFFSVCITLRERFSAMFVPGDSPSLVAYLNQARTVTEQFFQEHLDEALDKLLFEADEVMARYSRISDQFFWYTVLRRESDKEPHRVQIILHRTNARQINVVRDKEHRWSISPRKVAGSTQAFHCGVSVGLQGVQWVNWLPGESKTDVSHGRHPVYVHIHAIRRLHERIRFEEAAEHTVHDYFCEALRKPRFVEVGDGRLLPTAPDDWIENRGGKYMVAFCIPPYRLGYFTYMAMGEDILITTFLFLTMDGTPEAKLLEKNFGIVRRDIEHNNLDQLSTFLATDVQNDPKLRAHFEACRCGHLFTMVKPEFRGQLISGYAKELREYFCID
jgi:hypothetical protein